MGRLPHRPAEAHERDVVILRATERVALDGLHDALAHGTRGIGDALFEDVHEALKAEWLFGDALRVSDSVRFC